MEQFIEQAYEISKEMRKITPCFIMKKFHINFEIAEKICQAVWLRNHLEAREMMKEFHS